MTLKELLLKTYTERPDAVALRFKEQGAWHVLTYRDLLAHVRQVSQILANRRLRPGSHVAVYLDNCREWPEVYFGIVCAGYTAVPVDAKLHAQEVAHVLRNSEAVVAFASAKTYPVLREIEDQAALLDCAVLIGGKDIGPTASRITEYLDYAEQMEAVRAKAEADDCAFNARDPQESDVASIIYTSGTTGRQKGAMLTHRNFTANVESCLQAIQVEKSDNFLLVLPLHHSFAFTANLLVPMAVGAEISFVESLKTVGENVREVSPTVLVGVPLLFEKMYGRIMTGIRNKPLARLLYKTGLRKPVIKGIRKSLGGRLRLAVAGGAPSDPAILRGFAALGVPIIEGYGLTETAPVLTLNPLENPRPGRAGKPLPGVEIRIMEPNANGIGEIAARGPNIMTGYYKNPQATRDTFSDDWFLTGDLGFIDEDGYLTITGRKKSLIVNREGKNIYPEEVEAQILRSEFILEAVVLGYTIPGETGERVGAIVVPDQEALDAHTARGRTLTDEQVTELMLKEVRRVTQDISEYKRPRRIQVRTEEFEKTSTGKVKRYLYAIAPKEV